MYQGGILIGKRGPLSQVISHPRRREIVSRMIYGAKLADLAREFSVSEDSLWRFKKTGLVDLIAQEQLRLMANDLCKALLASEVESKRQEEVIHGPKE
jgi:hypothetical protein